YYAIGTPLFDTVKIHLDNQKTFTIVAHHATAKDIYIQSMKVNGQPTDTFYLSQSMILQGKTVSFQMGSQPRNQPNRVTAPPSGITAFPIVMSPVIVAKDNSFRENMIVSIQSPVTGSKLYYTLDHSAPGKKSPPYVKAFSIHDNTTVKAVAINNKGEESKIVTADFRKTAFNWNVTYLTTYNPQYNGGSDLVLIDGESGNKNFKSGAWQGWWGNDMELQIDLGKIQSVSSAGAEFLQDQQAWIILPSQLDIEGSADGKSFTRLSTVQNNISPMESNAIVQQLKAEFAPQQVRYIKLKAHNYGKLPVKHLSAGNDAWIFCDEIFIR
ncbi:MAG: glycoside hydrolase domain-containing protein, partial [Chitinophagales bacterium]